MTLSRRAAALSFGAARSCHDRPGAIAAEGHRGVAESGAVTISVHYKGQGTVDFHARAGRVACSQRQLGAG